MPAFNSILGSSQATHLFRSQLGFEAYLLVYLMTCFLLQNLNLYKTNIRSLDVGLVVFISVFLSRRLSLALCRKVVEGFRPGMLAGGGRAVTFQVLRTAILVVLLVALVWSLVLLARKASIFDCLFLFYPFIVYLSLFGFTLHPRVHGTKLFTGKTVYVQFVHSPHNSMSSSTSAGGTTDPSSSSPSSSSYSPSTSPSTWESRRSGNEADGSNSTTLSSSSSPNATSPRVQNDNRESSSLLHRNHRTIPAVGQTACKSPSSHTCTSCRGSSASDNDTNNNGKLTKRKGEQPRDGFTNGIVHGAGGGVHRNRHNLVDLPASPEEIRTEVESLLQDLVSRVKQLLFNSVLCTYYTTYIPLQFVEGHIFYDRWWCLQQSVIVWCTCFVLMASQLLPPSYCSGLHQLAVSCLGVWSRESCSQSVPEWSGRVAWSKDTVVRWDGEIFRADNPVNVAIPGNSSHEYFYHLFQSKVYIYTWLLALEVVALLMLLMALYKSQLWHQCITAAVLLGLNYYLFYKLLLNRLTLRGGGGGGHSPTA